MKWRCGGCGVLALGASLLWTAAAGACFGTHLRIGVSAGPAAGLAAYTVGYFVAEKTGIEPEFVELTTAPREAIADHVVDLVLVSAAASPPAVVELRPAGVVPGLGAVQFWLHPEVLTDLRFTTVERALGRAPALLASPPYAAAAAAGGPPRQAARQVVLDAQ